MFWNRKAKANQQTWRTPGGVEYNLIGLEVLNAPHTLIAGTTGSGKSTFLHSVLHSMLATKSPASAKIMLIDPKRVELGRYKHLPHVLRHETTPSGALEALKQASAIMEARYQEMEAQGIDLYNGADVYIIIDELADLMLSENAREIKKEMQHVLQLGRAARLHLIACTQCPNRKVIPAELVCNFTNRFGLRCLSQIESRQIIGLKGCEDLPPHGVAWYVCGYEANKYKLPYVKAEQIAPLINYWTSAECRKIA